MFQDKGLRLFDTLATVIGVVVLMAVVWFTVAGLRHLAINSTHREAARAGCGSFVLNPTTGEIEWAWERPMLQKAWWSDVLTTNMTKGAKCE